MNLNLLKGRVSRGRLVTASIVVLVLLCLALNLLLAHFGLINTAFIDITSEGLYSLSDLMKKECAFIDELPGDEKVKITFCQDPDGLVANLETRVVYFMALQMAKRFDNLEVETVNVKYNPTAVSKYKPTSLSEINPDDVIISYGDRYRVAGAAAFWVASDDTLVSYYGEYKMATLIMSVTAVNRPVAYFVTDHGETYYDAENPEREENINAAYLYDMLTDRGLEVKTLKLSEVESVPEDCVLLIINNPRSDFLYDPDRLDELDYLSETEKIDEYLIKNYGSVMISKDYSVSLPVFERFLYEWGFEIENALVKDESSYVEREDGGYTTVITPYDTDENSYGYTIYSDFASLSSAPSMVFDNTGFIKSSYGESESSNEPGTYDIMRSYASFFSTTDNAVAYLPGENGDYVSPFRSGAMDVAAVTSRTELNGITNEYKYSYVFCAASGDFFSNDYLGNSSYANYQVMSALTENMVRSDEYADMELGGLSMNSSNRGGKKFTDLKIYSYATVDSDRSYLGLTSGVAIALTVVIMLLPVSAAVVGIAVRIKRKYL